MAFKQATGLMANPLHKKSVDLIIERLSLKHSLIGAKKSLTRNSLYRAVSKGNNGAQSPAKKGPDTKIHATHAQLSQCSKGEMRGREIKILKGAAILGTLYDDEFTIDSVWRKVRRESPEHLQAANKMSVDDACAQWTTFDNLPQWFNHAKKDLIETGLVIDAEVRDRNRV